MSADLGVTGGVGGVAARYADMRVAAAVLTQEGGALDELGRTALRLLDVEDLLASAVLCPRGAAAAQIALLDAIAGPDGLVVAAAGVRLTGERLEAAADLYQRREEAIADLLVWRRELVGRTIGNAVGTVPPVLLVAGAVLTGGAMALPPVRNGVLVGAEEILEEHPGLTDEAAGHVPGVISGLASAAPGVAVGYTLRTGQSVHPETVAEAVGLVTPFLAVGRGRAAPVSPAAVGAGSSATRAPRGITDLMAGVHERGRESRAVPGLIGVRERPAAAGRPRAWVVELPGTQVWDLRSGSNPRDLSTNLQTVAGGTTAYQQAVVSALRSAKVGPGEPVLLVGHSQGGLTGAALAADPRVRKEFRITHVVTAGAPVAGSAVPASVQVLSLENRGDVVPRLEAAANRPTATHTTVVFDVPGESLGARHSLAAYAAGATAVDAAGSQQSPDPSLRAFLDGADDFLGVEAPAVLHRYQVLREPD